MKRGRFRQADIKRAVAGARAAGLDVNRVEIDPEGMIVLLAGQGKNNLETSNEWNEVLNEKKAPS